MEEQLELLVVEDEELDREFIARIFTRGVQGIKLNFASTAEQGLEKLRSLKHLDKVIVILDVNLPSMNGLELLEKIRADKDLSGTVVFVLSSSQNKDDRTRAFNNHVAGYLLKDEIGKNPAGFCRLVNYYRNSVYFSPLN